MIYSIEGLRKARQEREQADNPLAQAPPDAPHETTDAIAYWNGKRFVSRHEWLVSMPIEAFIDKEKLEHPDSPTPLPVRRAARRKKHYSEDAGTGARET